MPTSELPKVSLRSPTWSPMSARFLGEAHAGHTAPSTAPSPATGQPVEFGATKSKAASKAKKPQNKRPHTSPSANPPIVVPSLRWTAKPETFTVRIEPEFTVTCTVVHPVARTRWFPLAFKWSAISIKSAFRNAQLGLGFLTGCFRSQVEDEGEGIPALKAKSEKIKAKSKAKTGIAVEMDVFDDSNAHGPADSHEHPLPPIPSSFNASYTSVAPSSQRQRHSRSKPLPRAQMQAQTQDQQALKSIRRNSGWAGVFALPSSPSFANDAEDTGVDEHGRITRISGYGYEIDTANCILVVPDVAVGVAYSVKEELEHAGDSAQEGPGEMYQLSEVETGSKES